MKKDARFCMPNALRHGNSAAFAIQTGRVRFGDLTFLAAGERIVYRRLDHQSRNARRGGNSCMKWKQFAHERSAEKRLRGGD